MLTGCDVMALPDIGADFSRGAEISFFDHPQVIEEPGKIETTLDADACAAIRAAVAARLAER